MPEREQRTPEQFDAAAEAAREELMESVIKTYPDIGCDAVTMPDLAGWWKKWMPLAGHKRLGRLIMGVK